jgi:hypothetical protein
LNFNQVLRDKGGTCIFADLSAHGLEKHAWSMVNAGLIRATPTGFRG